MTNVTAPVDTVGKTELALSTIPVQIALQAAYII